LSHRGHSTIQKNIIKPHKQMIIFELQNKQIINNQNNKWKITPEKAHKMLTEEGMNVTQDEAAEILSFLRFLAAGTVKKFLKDSESDETVEDSRLDKKTNTPTKIKQKKNVSPEGVIYCSTCNFLNNNF
jgi:hypothetical protein